MNISNTFSYNDLTHIILGAHFYACGGGGALENGMQLLEEIKHYVGSKEKVSLSFIPISEVSDQATLPVLAAMGAPQEFLKRGYRHSPVTAFKKLEAITQTRFTTLSPVETGPIAYGMCFLAAIVNQLPIINGDGGGRAFPCLQLSTFTNPDLDDPIPVSPCILTSENSPDDDIVIRCNSASDIDSITRGVISHSTSFDQRASLAGLVMTGKQLKQPHAVVPDMILKCLHLGRQIDECRKNRQSCFEVIDHMQDARCIMKGRLNHIQSETKNGFDWVTLNFIPHTDTGNSPSQAFDIVAQNENMLLWSTQSPAPLAAAPDLICCFSADGSLMSNDEILVAWQKNPNDPRLQDMAIYTLPAAPQINQPWFHQNFSRIFKQSGYYGTYDSSQPANRKGEN